MSDTPNGPPNATPGRTRAGLSEIQKKALRGWVRSQEPRPTHAACIAWFDHTYGRRLDQSTVSRILSKRYAYLDSGPASAQHRQQPPQWPALEKQLSEWLMHAQDAGDTPNGEAIVKAAREMWSQIPDYQDKPLLQFSQGWLSNFRKRHTTRLNNRQVGVFPAAPPNARKEVQGLRTIAGEFMDEAIYGMDETGLLWRKAPFDAIPNESQPLLNKDRARICLVVCTNSTGSDRVPLWVIGHKEMPESLRGVNLEALDVRWRHNQKAWMNTPIMSEWLLFFYRHVGERRVLLLLDNFHAHAAAVESTPPPPNVHIQFSPAHATNFHHPLRLGVTQHLKLYYRKRWLAYIAAGFETGLSPIKAMSLYHSLCWITRNWRYDVANGTIYKAFRRSTLIDPQLDYLSAPKPPDVTHLFQTVAQYNWSGRSGMTLEEFLDPVAEEFDERSHEASWYLPETDTAELDEAVIPVATRELLPSPMAAVTGVQTAIRYMLHQSTTSIKDIQDLENIENFINRSAMNLQS